MCHLQKLSVALVVLCFLVCASIAQRDCNTFRCSNLGDGVWATDGKKCFVFNNGCLLALENCQRASRCEDELEVTTKEECQKLCEHMVCPTIYIPVCADWNGQKRTFSNSCALNLHICQTGETYNFYAEGECPV